MKSLMETGMVKEVQDTEEHGVTNNHTATLVQLVYPLEVSALPQVSRNSKTLVDPSWR